MENNNPSDDEIKAWAALVKTSDALTQSIRSDLKAHGLPCLEWYDILLKIKKAEPKLLRPFEIQQETLLAQYNISRKLDQLAEKNYIKRQACDCDARGQEIILQDEGREFLKQMWPICRDAIQKHFSNKLNEQDIINLSAILNKLKS